MPPAAWMKDFKANAPKDDGAVWQICNTPEGDTYYYNTITKETSWDKPEELMTDEELAGAGSWFWVPDPIQVYIPGKSVAADGSSTTCELDDGTTVTCKNSELVPLNRGSLARAGNVDDLVLLDDMTPPLILSCLKARFAKQLIYTDVGTITISINPYQMLPIYTDAVKRKYIQRGVSEEMPPHVYNNAHDSFIGLTEFGNNQSIIISGESGAGKTEATKQCLAYLSMMAGSVGGIEKKVQRANPIMEGFGNAKTIRNDNSSRFGKYMQMFFDPQSHKICGSTTISYLLEKIRVVQPADNERNYHIFYQLAEYASPKQREKFELQHAGDYRYCGKCLTVPTINDLKDFQDTEDAFAELMFSMNDVESIYATLSAILALGNCDFGKGDAAKVSQPKWVEIASRQLQVPMDAITYAMVTRQLRIKGQANTDVPLTGQEAGDTRDALGKFLYGNMFDWLVMKINKSMLKSGGKSTDASIGILDIFGFEIFEFNSFEQLCINFTNEMLQQHFNQHTFKLEEQIYKSECIKFQHVDFIDNQPMLDLITKKPSGILPLLDEELRMPKGSDAKFVDKLHQQQGQNRVYKKVLKNPLEFIVRHYAGDVKYQSEGFMDKNRDTLTTDLIEMLQMSTSKFINTLFPPGALDVDRKASLGKQFQQQLNDLMVELNRTEPHYIRCIKPNETKSACEFVPKNCMEQLTYSGVFEAVAIRKKGFPFRLTHQAFAERYAVVMGHGTPASGLSTCKEVTSFLGLSPDNIQVGKTMMLYRAEEHKKLELERNIKVKTKEVEATLQRLVNEVNPGALSGADKENYFADLAAAVRNADDFRMTSSNSDKGRKMLEAYIAEMMDPETKRLLNEGLRCVDRGMLEQALETCAQEGFQTSLTRQCQELLDQIHAADNELRAAMSEPSLDGLNYAIQQAQAFGYNGDTVQDAKAMLDTLYRTIDLLEKAVTGNPTMQGCEDALAAAASINFTNHPAIARVHQLIEQMNAAEAECRRGFEMKEEEILRNGVQLCDIIPWDCQMRQDALEMIRHLEDIQEGCRLAMESVDRQNCIAAVQRAEAFNMQWSQTKPIINDVRDLLIKIEQAEGMLQAGMEALNQHQIRDALDHCNSFGYKGDMFYQAEALMMRIIDAEAMCVAGVNNMNQLQLQDALEECDAFGYNSQVVQEARAMWERIVATENLVQAAIECMDQIQLRGALDEADAFGYNSDNVQEARGLYQRIIRAEEAVAESSMAMNEEALRDALAECGSFNYTSQTVEVARVLLDRIVAVEADLAAAVVTLQEIDLKLALDECREFGYNSQSVIDAQQLYDRILAVEFGIADGIQLLSEAALASAIDDANSFNYTSNNVDTARDLLARIRALEDSIADAMNLMEEAMLVTSIGDADAMNYNSPNIDEARELLQRIVQAEDMMARGRSAVDELALQDALAFSDGFGYNSINVREGRDLLMKIQEAIGLMEECMLLSKVCKQSVHQCDDALAAADAIGLYVPLVDQVTAKRQKMARPTSGPLARRIRRIVQETNIALNTYDEPHVLAIVSASDRAEYEDDWVLFFQSLVNGPYEEFLDAQFNKALEIKDNVRAVRVLVKRKKYMFEQSGDKYRVSLWAGLKTPAEWANGGGVFGGRHHPQGMFAFQKNMIHTSMTKGAHGMGKQVQFVFKTILCFMGQGGQGRTDESQSLLMAVNLLRECINNHALRDEVYTQIIKQLNQNSSMLYKGWMLMGLCLTVFPPSDSFADHLAYFLQQNSDTDHFNCRALLQERLFQQRIGELPTRDQMETLYKLLEAKGHELLEPNPPRPSWHDLLVAPAPNAFHPGQKGVELIEEVGMIDAAFIGGRNKFSQQNAEHLALKQDIGMGPWIMRQDPVTGAVFYFNTQTEESSWTKPKDIHANTRGPRHGSPWVMETDNKTGVPYYFNTESGESQWSCPDDF